MAKFELRKYYKYDDDFGYPPIKVLSRTAKYITVRNRHFQWKMMIRIDENGNEYVLDTVNEKHPYRDNARLRISACDETESVGYAW